MASESRKSFYNNKRIKRWVASQALNPVEVQNSGDNGDGDGGGQKKGDRTGEVWESRVDRNSASGMALLEVIDIMKQAYIANPEDCEGLDTLTKDMARLLCSKG